MTIEIDQTEGVDSEGRPMTFGIAPFVPDASVETASFREVHTCNLSRSSMAFFTQDAVEETEIAILMHTGKTEPIYVRAEVVTCRPSAYGDSQGYMVACSFLERLSGEAS